MATYEDFCKRRGIPYSPPPAQPEEPKRARGAGGRFKADDPSTPDVNEAFDPPKVKKSAAKKKSAVKKKPAPKKKAKK